MTEQIQHAVSDCWNQIGVRGDRSCEQLSAATHCRNCTIYASGARSIMQRPLPPGYSREWAEYFAREESGQKDLDGSALVFRVAGEWLALPAAHAVTVAEAMQPHTLPRRSGGILRGIVNVKGKLYPCMSLAHLMAIGDDQPTVQPGRRIYPRMLVMELAYQAFALPVDDLHGIHRYAESDLQPVPTTANKAMHRYLTGVLSIENMRIGCLDPELVGYNLASALK